MALVQDDAAQASSSAVSITLEEGGIEGAVLDEPLESKTILQLRWWLLCHGKEPPGASSQREESGFYIGHEHFSQASTVQCVTYSPDYLSVQGKADKG